MQFLRKNKRRKDERQREVSECSLSTKNNCFYEEHETKYRCLRSLPAPEKTWIQNKVCLHKHVNIYKNHTRDAKTVSCIESTTQENGLETVEYQFILPPGLTCGWVKCHWFGWFCISFATGLCPALKPIYKDLSNCLATFQGGRQKCCRLGFHPWGWMLAVISLSWWNTIYLTWN